MKTEQAIEYAGSPKALADLLGITPSAISQWGDEVPPARQFQIEQITEGKLKADPDCLERLLQPKARA
jgi:transcriptional repressor of cell division inhibition gene dicB